MRVPLFFSNPSATSTNGRKEPDHRRVSAPTVDERAVDDALVQAVAQDRDAGGDQQTARCVAGSSGRWASEDCLHQDQTIRILQAAVDEERGVFAVEVALDRGELAQNCAWRMNRSWMFTDRIEDVGATAMAGSP